MSGPWQTPKKKGQKKNQYQHFKRKQVPASDGWTAITHRSTSHNGTSRIEVTLDQAPQRPTTIVPDLDVAKLLSEFSKLEQRWQDGECARKLSEILETRKGQFDVQNAVCVGIGSFSLDWENRWRSMWQLALFIGVVKTVTLFSSSTVTTDVKIELFAQEPAFTDLDIEFLAALEPPVKVINTGIEERIMPSTFIFVPFLDWNVLLPTFLEDRDPALYVGNEILDDYSAGGRGEERDRNRKKCEGIGAQFLIGREMVQVPECDLDNSLMGLVIYWKVGGEEEETDKGKETETKVADLTENFAQTTLST